jgi:hypothetical protein
MMVIRDERGFRSAGRPGQNFRKKVARISGTHMRQTLLLAMEGKPIRRIEDDELRILCQKFPAHALAIDLARIILRIGQT